MSVFNGRCLKQQRAFLRKYWNYIAGSHASMTNGYSAEELPDNIDGKQPNQIELAWKRDISNSLLSENQKGNSSHSNDVQEQQ